MGRPKKATVDYSEVYDPAYHQRMKDTLGKPYKRSEFSVKDRQTIWERDGGHCVQCHKPLTVITGVEYHHIIPQSYGGKNVVKNACLLCPDCHKSTHRPGETVGRHLEHYANFVNIGRLYVETR
jgi:RNA-directed DNA polymerase